MAKDQETLIKVRRMVRDTIALEPGITLRSMQELFRHKNFDLSIKFLASMRKKVNREIIAEQEHTKIGTRIAEIREEYRMMMKPLEKIAHYIYDPADPSRPPTYSERIKAIDTLGRLKERLLKMEMDSGIYTRQLGVVGHIHKHTVEEKKEEMEELGVITTALENWGIVPKLADIPPEEPKQVEAVVVEPVQEIKENATNTTTA